MTNTPTLHVDKIKFGGKILYKDEKITVVPCVLMAEGVQNNALKPFEEFYDPNGLEGALWFEGVPIVREHPQSYVTHLTPKIGRIRNVQPDVEGRRITAEAVLFNDSLTPAEMKAIEEGEQLGGSIGFWCEDEPCSEPQIWTDGTEYNCIQKKPFFGDHFAMVTDPACPVGVCGFNVESNHNDCKCKKLLEVTNLPDETGKAAEKQPVIENQKPPAGDPKPPEGDEAKIPDAPKKNAMDMGALVIKAQTILEMADDYAKRGEALALLMEIVTEGGSSATVAANSKPQKKIVVEMDNKILDAIKDLGTKIDSQKEEIDTLKADKQAREAAIKAESDEKTKNSLKANFDQAYQMEFDKHWPVIQKDGINMFLATPEHAKHWDVKGDRRTITPIGAAFVQHDSDSEEAEIDSMGVPSEEDLHKKLGGKKA
jgi:hypothetical protein